MEAVYGYIGSGEVVSCSSLLCMGGERWRAGLCLTPFNECSVDGFSGGIGMDGFSGCFGVVEFSGCIGSREVVSVLILVRCGRSLLWCRFG